MVGKVVICKCVVVGKVESVLWVIRLRVCCG